MVNIEHLKCTELCYWATVYLCCCVLHGNAGDTERNALSQFLENWPSVESALGATWPQVHSKLAPYGVTPDTAKTLLRFCGQFIITLNMYNVGKMYRVRTDPGKSWN